MKLYLEDDDGRRVPVTKIEHFEQGKVNCLLMRAVLPLRESERLSIQQQLTEEIGVKVVVVTNLIDTIVAI